MDKLSLLAYGKINLSLDVKGRIYNGYHEVSMLMQSISLCDRLDFTVNDEGAPSMSLTFSFAGTPDSSNPEPVLSAGDDNLVMKAARKLYDAASPRRGVHIHLTKAIPMAAGLGGGSADAAAALIGVNKVLGLGLSDYELWRLAIECGADVPFCLRGGLMLCEGIGELLTPLDIPPTLMGMHLVLAKPSVSVSTADIYRRLDDGFRAAHPDNVRMMALLKSNDAAGALGCTDNVLEAVTGPEHPLIGRIEAVMRDKGALLAMMSGSGPTVYGVFAQKDEAEAAVSALSGMEGLSDLREAVCMDKGVKELQG